MLATNIWKRCSTRTALWMHVIASPATRCVAVRAIYNTLSLPHFILFLCQNIAYIPVSNDNILDQLEILDKCNVSLHNSQ